MCSLCSSLTSSFVSIGKFCDETVYLLVIGLMGAAGFLTTAKVKITRLTFLGRTLLSLW